MAASFHFLQGRTTARMNGDELESSLRHQKNLADYQERRNELQRPIRVQGDRDASLYSHPSFPVRSSPQKVTEKLQHRKRPVNSAFINANPPCSKAFMPSKVRRGGQSPKRRPDRSSRPPPVTLQPDLKATATAQTQHAVMAQSPTRRVVGAPVKMVWTEGMDKLVKPFNAAAWHEIQAKMPEEAARIAHPGIVMQHCIYCHQANKPYVAGLDNRPRGPWQCPVCGNPLPR